MTSNKHLGTIFNNDNNNILIAMDGAKSTLDDYRRAFDAILDGDPGVVVQTSGCPEAVLYPTEVDNTFDKHLVETTILGSKDPDMIGERARRQCGFLQKMLASGTNPLTLSIQAGRDRGIPILAGYRMNAEDWHENTWMLSDFGRAHPEWRIPLTEEEKADSAKAGSPLRTYTGALDPAVPEVFEHRMAIFREATELYDIDGIEFDFRRWWHMVSDPKVNHPVLTRMVRQTRRMLDEVAVRKGKDRLLLGARVCPSLSDPPGTLYPGGSNNASDWSCREIGLDVTTWIQEDLLDYVCPSLFWPRWPGLPKTREFVELARDRITGVYPTLFPLPPWVGRGSEDKPIDESDTKRLRRYKDEICRHALTLYEEGADGISTFNWYFHLYLARCPVQWQSYYNYGFGGARLQSHFYSILGNPEAIRQYRDRTDILTH